MAQLEKTPDQTASELEQQRNVLVLLFPSLEMEVRAASGFVEIPLSIVRRQRKWFQVELLVSAPQSGAGSRLPGSDCPGRAASGHAMAWTLPSVPHSWGVSPSPRPLRGAGVAQRPATCLETLFHFCWCFLLAAVWYNWNWKRLGLVRYQLLEELFPFLHKAVDIDHTFTFLLLVSQSH